MAEKPTYEELESRVKELKSKEDELSQIFSMSLDMICIADIKTATFIKVNPAFIDVLGYSEEELLGKSFLDFIHSEDIDATRTVVEKKLQSGAKVISFENRYRCKDGSYRWLSWVSHPKIEQGVTYAIARDITERKRAEDHLKRNEKLYRTIFSDSHTPIFMVDEKSRSYIDANQAALNFMECTKEQLVGRSVYEKSPPEKIEQAKNEHANFSEVKSLETEYLVNDKIKSLLLEVTPLKLDGDSILIGIGQDITERKRAEEKVHASQERFRLAFDTKHVAWALSRQHDGVYLDASPGFLEITGYSHDELVGRSSRELAFFTDESRRGMLANIRQYGHLRHEELTFRTKQNEWRTIIFSISPVTVKGEDCLSATMVDITERKKSQEALKASEMRFKKILQNVATVAVQGYALDGTVRYWNRASETLYGYTAEEALGRNLLDLIIPHAMHDNVKGAIRHMAETGEPIPSSELELMHKDGSLVPVYSSHAHVQLPGQDPELFCVDIDLTELKHAEAERQKLQSRLQQTQKMESIGSLAGGIAHDFNNILFPIIGYSQLIIDDFDPGSPEHESLKAIMDAGERGRNLVQQILAIGRQSEQKPIPVLIQTVLKEVMKLIRSTIPANIHITKDIQKDCGTVKADPTQLHQIAMNLITNASHALEDDVGEIAVSLKEVVLEPKDVISENLNPGRYALLTVSDTGSGISPDIMDKLFDPYFTTKEQGKGTGLGLSVVHGIIKRYGGDIKVYSELGKGTSFHVYLPVVDKAEKNEETEKSSPLPTGNERILVVDDEASIIRLEEALLKKLGYEVSSRTGSIDALEKFKMDPYALDLVLTDMSMPNMTGERLAREMIAIRPDIPVILCTGFSERFDEKKAETAGVKAFLMKPIVNRDIAETVRKVLDEAKS
ncbi:MAG: PAS domain S-box protein [Desulfobacteraceae bacterium]